jgi:hypothetical protein
MAALMAFLRKMPMSPSSGLPASSNGMGSPAAAQCVHEAVCFYIVEVMSYGCVLLAILKYMPMSPGPELPAAAAEKMGPQLQQKI